nr:helix-turn-helix transcriptional regulator [Pontibacter liquoris]
MHLRRLREERGLSQQELADLADVSKLTVQRTENAKFSATLDVLISISRALRVSLPELVNFDVPEESTRF